MKIPKDLPRLIEEPCNNAFQKEEGKHCGAEKIVYCDPKKDGQREYKKKTRKGDKKGEEEIMQ